MLKKIEIDKITNYAQDYAAIRSPIENTIKYTYTDFLSGAKKNDGSHPKSVKDLVDSYGSWDATIAANSYNKDGIQALLSGVNADKTGLLSNFDKLRSYEQMKEMREHLDTLCSNYTTISKNIIDTRNWCNLNIINTFALNTTSVSMIKMVFSDLINTKNAYPKANIVLPYSTIDAMNTDFKNKFDNYIVEKFADKTTGPLFDPTAGLPFVDRLAEINCADTQTININGVRTTVTTPNVLAWYYNNGDKTKSYIK